jgi:hypothetical protein
MHLSGGVLNPVKRSENFEALGLEVEPELAEGPFPHVEAAHGRAGHLGHLPLRRRDDVHLLQHFFHNSVPKS